MTNAYEKSQILGKNSISLNSHKSDKSYLLLCSWKEEASFRLIFWLSAASSGVAGKCKTILCLIIFKLLQSINGTTAEVY